MKKLLHGFVMCQSMFCAIPCPWNVWDEDARPNMLLWLPMVGLEMGLLWYALAWLCCKLGLNALLAGAALCAFPFLITGSIHLDGFMDVRDAIGSYRTLERRREILKDSHVGSFAVISCCLLMLAQFAFCASLRDKDLRVLIFIPVVSRSFSVLAVSRLPKMGTSQYAGQKKRMVDILVPVLYLLAAFVITSFMNWKYIFVLLGGCVGYLLPLRKAYRSLEGMNGDISGYALTISELTSLGVLALLSGGIL